MIYEVKPFEKRKNRFSIQRFVLVLQFTNLKHFLKMFLRNFQSENIASDLRPQLNIRRSNVNQRIVRTAPKSLYTMPRTKIICRKYVFPSYVGTEKENFATQNSAVSTSEVKPKIHFYKQIINSGRIRKMKKRYEKICSFLNLQGRIWCYNTEFPKKFDLQVRACPQTTSENKQRLIWTCRNKKFGLATPKSTER